MSKPIFLLDTNIISELGKMNPNQSVVDKIALHKSQCAIPSTTWNELLYGLQNMPEGKTKDFYFKFIVDYIQSEFPILPYDNYAAWIQADIRSRLKSEGTPQEFEDTQIASIAISNQMILVTRNIKHFQQIQNVDSVLYLENWFED